MADISRKLEYVNLETCSVEWARICGIKCTTSSFYKVQQGGMCLEYAEFEWQNSTSLFSHYIYK